MGLLFESKAGREAREAAHREKVRRKRDGILERDGERKACRDAVGRYVFGLWKTG